MDKIMFNGIGSNYFGKYSTSSFMFNSTESDWILIDVGPDTPRIISNNGIKFLQISTIVLTHKHLDHCLGLPYLLFGRRLEVLAQRKHKSDFIPTPLTVISDPDLFEKLKDLYNYCHPDSTNLLYPINNINICDSINSSIDLEDISLSTVLMDHTVETYGILVKDRFERTLAYTSDSSKKSSFIDLAKDSDVLVVEAMVLSHESVFASSTKHATAQEAGEIAREIAAKQNYLIHLRPSGADNIIDLELEAASAACIELSYPKEGLVYRPWD